MDGWGRRFIVVTPDGRVQPCHLAGTLPGLALPRVHDAPLSTIWSEAPAFNAFRGEAWMAEPCRSCPRRHEDFGGCRCQAWALTGDAAATDPACRLAPAHGIVLAARAATGDAPPEIVHRAPAD
jgi:pyrroloquinoline quinone biosynthesis protein E